MSGINRTMDQFDLQQSADLSAVVTVLKQQIRNSQTVLLSCTQQLISLKEENRLLRFQVLMNEFRSQELLRLSKTCQALSDQLKEPELSSIIQQLQERSQQEEKDLAATISTFDTEKQRVKDVALISPVAGYTIETYGWSLPEEDYFPKIIENSPWYSRFFVRSSHCNFAAASTSLGPALISVMRDSSSHYRALIRSKFGDEKIMVPVTALSHVGWRTEDCKLLHHKFANANFSLIPGHSIFKNLLDLETKSCAKNFKIGVLFAKQGQTDEEQMFNNCSGSLDFEEFLDFLGDRVKLKGFIGSTGGLQTRDDQTGKFSVYTTFQGNEIMFHVSTLLPHNWNDRQQIEKKRHIGNDIVLLVFVDGNTPYNPFTVRSTFIHVVIVVQVHKGPDPGKRYYKVSVACKDGIPLFEPHLPHPGVFEKTEYFRKFLLTKIVSAELTALKHIPQIQVGRDRILKHLISEQLSPLELELSKKASDPKREEREESSKKDKKKEEDQNDDRTIHTRRTEDSETTDTDDIKFKDRERAEDGEEKGEEEHKTPKTRKAQKLESKKRSMTSPSSPATISHTGPPPSLLQSHTRTITQSSSTSIPSSRPPPSRSPPPPPSPHSQSQSPPLSQSLSSSPSSSPATSALPTSSNSSSLFSSLGNSTTTSSSSITPPPPISNSHSGPVTASIGPSLHIPQLTTTLPSSSASLSPRTSPDTPRRSKSIFQRPKTPKENKKEKK